MLGSARRAPFPLLLLLCAASAVGCTERSEQAELQGVVLVVLDTVRADHLGTYGYTRHPTSPRLDALAAEGSAFENAIASAPWTLPSMAALFSARHPGRALDQGLRHSLVESLQAAGVATAAFTEGAYVSAQFGMQRGFDTFVEQKGPVVLAGEGARVQGLPASGIEATFDAALDWIAQVGERRFFLLVHTYEPHTPYVNREFARALPPGRLPPIFGIHMLKPLMDGELVLTPEENAYLQALYDGDLRTSDRQLGRLLDALAKHALDQRVAVVVTSDHGEEMGEHYPHRVASHGHSLRDSLLRVPLVVRDPTRPLARRRVREQVRVMDTMPTVLQMLGVPMPDESDGRSLLPLLAEAEESERVAIAGQLRSGPRRVAVRAGGYKFIASLPSRPERSSTLRPPPPARQLYALGSDPGEQHNLADAEPERLASFEPLVPSAEAAFRKDLDEDVARKADTQLIERLRSLGYVD